MQCDVRGTAKMAGRWIDLLIILMVSLNTTTKSIDACDHDWQERANVSSVRQQSVPQQTVPGPEAKDASEPSSTGNAITKIKYNFAYFRPPGICSTKNEKMKYRCTYSFNIQKKTQKQKTTLITNNQLTVNLHLPYFYLWGFLAKFSIQNCAAS